MVSVKKYCLIAFHLFIINNIFAQNFISEDKTWSVLINGDDGEHQSQWINTNYFHFSGDTIIDEKKFQKLYWSEDKKKSNWNFYSFWIERNDSVFEIQYWNPTEQTLVYDFNVVEGDSFFLAGSDHPEILMIVDSIKTKEWGNKLRKHYYFHYPGMEDRGITTWIKGVGHINNPTRSSNYFFGGTTQSMLCFEENGQLVYQNPIYNSCWVNYSSIQSHENQKQLINLFSTENGLLQLQITSNISGKITFYTPEGKQVLKKVVNGKGSSFCAPASGTLLYHFENKKGEIQTGKVMVK